MGRLRALVLCVCIGVGFTLASAWGLALFGGFVKGDLVATYDEANTKVPAHLVPAGWDIRSWHFWTGPGISRDLVSECIWMGSTLGMTTDGRPQRTVTHVRVGFPCYSMTWYDFWSEAPRAWPSPFFEIWFMGWDVGHTAVKGLAGSSRFGVKPRLPVRPVWTGFAINAFFYSVLAFAAIRGRGAWVHSRRRRAGCCEACGYSLGGSGRCPECGNQGRENAPA